MRIVTSTLLLMEKRLLLQQPASVFSLIGHFDIKNYFKDLILNNAIMPIIVATGNDQNDLHMDNVEILSPYIDCQVDQFPMRVTFAKQSNRMICGGEQIDLKPTACCWSLNPNGTWMPEGNMTEPKFAFSLTLFKNDLLFSIGGKDSNNDELSTIEIFNTSSPRQWIKWDDAPFPIAYHCTVELNSSLFVIGGTMDYRMIREERYKLQRDEYKVSINDNQKNMINHI